MSSPSSATEVATRQLMLPSRNRSSSADLLLLRKARVRPVGRLADEPRGGVTFGSASCSSSSDQAVDGVAVLGEDEDPRPPGPGASSSVTMTDRRRDLGVLER